MGGYIGEYCNYRGLLRGTLGLRLSFIFQV